MFLGYDVVRPGRFYPGLGTLSLDVGSPTFGLLLSGAVIGQTGQLSLPVTVPPAIGATVHLQALLFPSASAQTPLITNVESATILP